MSNVEKYTIQHYKIQSILGFINSGKIAVPEIQRPFVWKRQQVCDFIDSLYNGYPVGYLIAWHKPEVKLRDGNVSSGGDMMLIDGQQRVTAMMAALLGQEVLNDDYESERISIAFNPFPGPDENRFEVSNSFIRKNPKWIPDISVLFVQGYSSFRFVSAYCNANPQVANDDLITELEHLRGIVNLDLGVIELSSDLDVGTVSEIFVRVNSKGTVLNQSDFVMSKMSSDFRYGGELTRKTIDYFCHTLVKPQFVETVRKNDSDFYAERGKYLAWIPGLGIDLYRPGCEDLIRAVFIYGFRRSRMEDLVSLLSGRNFETRTYEEEVAEHAYRTMDASLKDAVKESAFKGFLVCIQSTGFRSGRLISSQMGLDFAYALYLILSHDPKMEKDKVSAWVGRWFVMSVLTRRYSTSPESAMGRDLRLLGEIGVRDSLQRIEAAELSDAFWEQKLVLDLEAQANNNLAHKVYLAAQLFFNDESLLTVGTKVSDLFNVTTGDVHHIFPKNYLRSHGFKQADYNQVANYAFIEQKLNIAIADRAPEEYFGKVREQCQGASVSLGDIRDYDTLRRNLEENCVPEEVFEMDYTRYGEFLGMRRKLMAEKIRRYYQKLQDRCERGQRILDLTVSTLCSFVDRYLLLGTH